MHRAFSPCSLLPWMNDEMIPDTTHSEAEGEHLRFVPSSLQHRSVSSSGTLKADCHYSRQAFYVSARMPRSRALDEFQNWESPPSTVHLIYYRANYRQWQLEIETNRWWIVLPKRTMRRNRSALSTLRRSFLIRGSDVISCKKRTIDLI